MTASRLARRDEMICEFIINLSIARNIIVGFYKKIKWFRKLFLK